MANRKDKTARYRQLINSQRWRTLRAKKLTNAPLCERCLKEYKRTTPATEVHHVIPAEQALTFKEMERLMFDYFNLQSLCHRCHALTHIEIGKPSKQMNKERTEQKLKQFKLKFDF